MGASGEVWWNRHSAQSIPSMLVPELRPRTVKLRAVMVWVLGCKTDGRL